MSVTFLRSFVSRELVLGQQLFHGPSVEHVLAAQEAVLGGIPEHMVHSSATRNLYFTPSGDLYTLDPPGHPAGAYLLVPVQTDLCTLLDTEDDIFIEFLSSLLSLDPEKRFNAREALAHPWLTTPGMPPPSLPQYLQLGPREQQQVVESDRVRSTAPPPVAAGASSLSACASVAMPVETVSTASLSHTFESSSSRSHATKQTGAGSDSHEEEALASCVPLDTQGNEITFCGAPQRDNGRQVEYSADDASAAERLQQAQTPSPHLALEQDSFPQEQRAIKHERRGSFDGPSVPISFREAAAVESSRSHEFRQKLMRLVVGNRGSSEPACTE